MVWKHTQKSSFWLNVPHNSFEWWIFLRVEVKINPMSSEPWALILQVNSSRSGQKLVAHSGSCPREETIVLLGWLSQAFQDRLLALSSRWLIWWLIFQCMVLIFKLLVVLWSVMGRTLCFQPSLWDEAPLHKLFCSTRSTKHNQCSYMCKAKQNRFDAP